MVAEDWQYAFNELARRVADLESAAGQRVEARRVAPQTITNSGADIDILFDTEDVDTAGYFAPTSANFTIPAGFDGWYGINFEAQAAASVVNALTVSLRVDGLGPTGVTWFGTLLQGTTALVHPVVYAATTVPTTTDQALFLYLRAGQVVKLVGRNNAANASTTVTVPMFKLVRLAP